MIPDSTQGIQNVSLARWKWQSSSSNSPSSDFFVLFAEYVWKNKVVPLGREKFVFKRAQRSLQDINEFFSLTRQIINVNKQTEEA